MRTTDDIHSAGYASMPARMCSWVSTGAAIATSQNPSYTTRPSPEPFTASLTGAAGRGYIDVSPRSHRPVLRPPRASGGPSAAWAELLFPTPGRHRLKERPQGLLLQRHPDRVHRVIPRDGLRRPAV